MAIDFTLTKEQRELPSWPSEKVAAFVPGTKSDLTKARERPPEIAGGGGFTFAPHSKFGRDRRPTAPS